MKYRNLRNPITERVFFKPQEPIMKMIYDRLVQFIETTTNNPNAIYMGPKAYHDLMEIAYDKNYQPESDFGMLMGMRVHVSSQLMKNDIILLRTI